MPASDAKKIVSSTPRAGAYENNPPSEEISPLRVLRETARITANIPKLVAAYTMRYTTTARRAASPAAPPATASGIKMKPPWLTDE